MSWVMWRDVRFPLPLFDFATDVFSYVNQTNSLIVNMNQSAPEIHQQPSDQISDHARNISARHHETTENDKQTCWWHEDKFKKLHG